MKQASMQRAEHVLMSRKKPILGESMQVSICSFKEQGYA